jgi:hypothetical protein
MAGIVMAGIMKAEIARAANATNTDRLASPYPALRTFRSGGPGQ